MIAPAPANPTSPHPSLLRVGGLSVLVRALHVLQQAGVEDLTVVAEGDPEPLAKEVGRESRLKSTRFLTAAEIAKQPAPAGGDFLLVLADRVFSPKAVEDLIRAGPESLLLLDEGGRFSGLALCRASCMEEVVGALGGGGDLAGRLEGAIRSAVQQPPKRGLVERVQSSTDARRAEDRLLKGLVKETDSFLTRHIDRRISLAITRRLARTRITPNQITLLHFCIGLAGAVLFAQPVRWVQVLGALVFLFSSTVDGCDGEIARLKFQQSRLGGFLDIWLDNVVHIAVFAAIAVALHREAPADRFLWLGIFACLGVLLSVGTISWKTLRHKSGAENFFVSVGGEAEADAARKPKKDWIQNIDDYLARRDFIYLLIPLAAFGKLEWFLWAAAIGGNLFFLSLLVLYARAKTQANS